jgi:hypothetical protein
VAENTFIIQMVYPACRGLKSGQKSKKPAKLIDLAK